MVVFIGFDTSFCVFDVKVEILELLENGFIDGDSMKADNYSTV